MSVKKTAAAERRLSHALEIFEKGMKALGKREYERARELFDELIRSHGEERDLAERALAYRTLCERALDKRPAFRPKSFEELLNYGVFLHNKGEFQEALKYLHQAAEIHPKNEHALYCIAAASARAGDTPAATKALRSAILANPACRTQARSDSDFDPVREDEEFATLLRPQAS